MSEPMSPMMQMPLYYPYHHHHGSGYSEGNMASLQHQFIDKNVSDSAKDINRNVTSAEQSLTANIARVGDTVSGSSANLREAIGSTTLGIRDLISGSVLGLRDATERSTTAISTNMSTNAVASADRDRDLQVTTERVGANGASTTERNSSAILQAIERNAGESRYSTALLDATNRQATNDLSRDIIMQGAKGNTDLMSAIERNGSAAVAATTMNGYETRTLINSNSNLILNSIGQSTEKLASQSANHYASMLLEQQKVKEGLSLQLAESKYEALKNKESLSAQMAVASSESKYEALKNTQLLAAQIAECCCEIKTKVSDVSSKVDDSLRTLDSQRVRDALNVANNEINLLKIANSYDGHRGGEYHYHHDRGRSRSPRGGR